MVSKLPAASQPQQMQERENEEKGTTAEKTYMFPFFSQTGLTQEYGKDTTPKNIKEEQF